MAKQVQINDIVEIPTAKGLRYAQFSHRHPRYGALLRILPGSFESRPSDFSELVRQPESFVTFFPIQSAVSRNIVQVVASYPVPSFAKPFPLFRCGVIVPETGKVKEWWFWDGEKEWKVGNLTTEQRKLPLRGIWNDTLLVERLETGWTPESDQT